MAEAQKEIQMTARQDLSQVHRMRQRINAIRLREEELRTKAEGLRAIVYDSDRVQKSVENRFDAIMQELITVEEARDTLAHKYETALFEISDQIDRMESDRQREILRLRYLVPDEYGRQCTIYHISEIMNIKPPAAKRLHERALKTFCHKYLNVYP